MSPNSLRSDARPLVGCTLGFGAIFSAQLIARAGYDWVLVDMEHNPLSASQATSMTHAVIAASAGRCQPLVRVPSHAVEWTKWALDSGAYGLVVPMVNSAEEARRIVQNAAYPPLGQRSFGPARAPFANVDPATTVLKYRDEISKDVQIIAMIESIQGLQNAEEIIAVEGITAVFVGPVDLRMSMGLKGGDGTEDDYLEALKKLIRAGVEPVKDSTFCCAQEKLRYCFNLPKEVSRKLSEFWGISQDRTCNFMYLVAAESL
ncbi:hypothetical protein KCU71_g201, partial [Aureobasidium melanogenum]